MLPTYDPELDTKRLNIFQPISTFSLYQLEHRPLQQQEQKQNKPSDPTYCKACKKKFSNEPTFQNHLKSAKHIANEKKFGKTDKTSTQRVPINPQVQDVLQKLEQAKKSTDYSNSVSVYWTQAQVLYGLKRPIYVKDALELLIDILTSNDKEIKTLSSAQVTSLVYSSRLALARLHCIYQELDKARSIYLDALETKWKLERNEITRLSELVENTSLSQLLEWCDVLATRYLTRERNRTKPAPAITDLNNSFTTILKEAGNIFAQDLDVFENKCLSEHIAIILYAVSSLVCPFEGDDANDSYAALIKIYTNLGLHHRVLDVKVLDKNDKWNTFTAFVLCVEIDDLVRAKSICNQLKQQCSSSLVYPDVKLLYDIYDHKLTLDRRDLDQDLDYIQLLLRETTEPLLIRERSTEEQLDTINRMRSLI